MSNRSMRLATLDREHAKLKGQKRPVTFVTCTWVNGSKTYRGDKNTSRMRRALQSLHIA